MRALKRVLLIAVVVVVVLGAYALWLVYGAWPVPAGYEFPRHPMWGGGPLGLFEGKLVEEDGCIRTGNSDYAATVVWPPGYSLELNGGRPEVHGSGQVVGMGVSVRLVGAGYETRDQLASVFAGAAETRCAAPFFLTTGFAD